MVSKTRRPGAGILRSGVGAGQAKGQATTRSNDVGPSGKIQNRLGETGRKGMDPKDGVISMCDTRTRLGMDGSGAGIRQCKPNSTEIFRQTCDSRKTAAELGKAMAMAKSQGMVAARKVCAVSKSKAHNGESRQVVDARMGYDAEGAAKTAGRMRRSRVSKQCG